MKQFEHSFLRIIVMILGILLMGRFAQAQTQGTSLGPSISHTDYMVEKGPSLERGLEQADIRQEPISGTVTDAQSGESMPGVNIVVKGTTTGTSTDANGNYELTVPSLQDTLVVSFVGYQTKEISINGRSEINIQLVSGAITGEEMVVVGYGTQQKEEITGSISSVSPEDLTSTELNVNDQLIGKVSGLQIQQTRGSQPGAETTIRIRGTSSISAGSEPLYVVDGFPGVDNISDLNPANIESIEVLKDASASAIYGSRGSGGVVIIETKKGISGEPKIDFSSEVGFQRAERKLDMLNSEQFAALTIEARNNSWVDRGGNASDPNSVRPAAERLRIPTIFMDPASTPPGGDHQDAILRDAAIQKYNLSVSGGGENATYFVSGSYNFQNGIIRGTDFKRYNLRANIDIDISENLTLGTRLAPNFSIRNTVPVEGHWASNGVVNAALATIPVIPIFEENGDYADQTGFGFGFPEIASPYGITQEVDDKTNRFSGNGVVFAEIDFLDNFLFKTSFGIDIFTSDRQFFTPSIVDRRRSPSRGEFEETRRTNWVSETTLNYNNSFNQVHNVDVLGGFTLQEENRLGAFFEATNFANDRIRTFNNGQVASGNTTQEEWTLQSYIGRVNYNYDEKYLVSASVRADGSSRFGEDNRWGIFPSVSLGWRVMQEGFMSDISFINNLKIRGSFGKTGNNTIPNFVSRGLTTADNYVFGEGTGDLANGNVPETIPNPDLGWEETTTLDIGIDLALLNNRLTFTTDYYTSNTEDLLLNVPIPFSSGYTTTLQNIGEVRNKGWELSFNSRNFTGELTWLTDFNISFNDNEVQRLGPGGDPIITGTARPQTHITRIGEPIGMIYGYEQIGIYMDQQDLESNPSTETSRPGDVKYRDVNDDGVINADGDQTIIGNPHPDFTWGMTNNLLYKNFDLSFTLQAVHGNDVLSIKDRFMANLEMNQGQYSGILDRWQSPENPGDGMTPRVNARTTGQNNSISSRWVEDGSFIRIRNITLGYDIPVQVIGNARIYASVQNAYTFTDYRGYNPQTNLEGDTPLTPGTDYGGYPIARMWTFGIEVGL